MSDSLTFSVGEGISVTVESYAQLETWLHNERAKWSWLRPGDGRTDRTGFANNLKGAWENLVQQVAVARSQNQPLAYLQQFLTALGSPPLLLSTQANGVAVLDILETHGDVPAAFAAGFLQRQIGINNAMWPEELLGGLLAIIPNLTKTVEFGDQLKRERSTFRAAARDVIDRVDRAAEERRQANAVLIRRVGNIGQRFFDRRRARWREAQTKWQASADAGFKGIADSSAAAIGNINQTQDTYREFMKLKAPVEYWNAKAAAHKIKETSARRWLFAYFPITIIALAIVFVCSGNFLLTHPDMSGSKAPVALYLVVSGGLLLASTMAFWIGRLLTKLYLSEHHLRNDAEERATMTTTYLALTTEGAAADTDRQIILNALFRATPDGIVKDDGPPDAGLQAILSRILMKS